MFQVSGTVVLASKVLAPERSSCRLIAVGPDSESSSSFRDLGLIGRHGHASGHGD
jgi:hypothetical protein